MSELSERMTHVADRLIEIEATCAQQGHSFPDVLREILSQVQAFMTPDPITRTRPGCWEAEHLRALAGTDWVLRDA